MVPSRWSKRINASNADVAHLHQVHGGILSVADIGRIDKPVLWALHDMLVFSDAEHLAWGERWREGYRRDNRPAYETVFDLNRWTLQLKRKHWRRPMHIVAPSRWLADCASESLLMRDWPVAIVPNPVDTERWKPLEQSLVRNLLGLPSDVPLLLFGAMDGTASHHKGVGLLACALGHLHDETRARGLELFVFCQRARQSLTALGLPVHYTGHLNDNHSLQVLYSAADPLVVPSRQEAFGQAASQAHACATLVIAFDTRGLPDIAVHHRTGYLAKAFDTLSLASDIARVLAQRSQHPLGAEQYRQLYRTAAALK